MICPNCNKEIHHNSKFCTSCGKEVIKDAKDVEKEKVQPKKGTYFMRGCLQGCGGFLITAIVIVSAIYVAYKHPFNLFKISDKDLENAIVEQSNEMNKTLPMKVDNVTELVNTTALGKEFTYYYKVSDNNNLSQSNLDNSLKSKIVNQACMPFSDTKKLLDKGVILTYIYNYSSGKYVGKISIQKSDCK